MPETSLSGKVVTVGGASRNLGRAGAAVAHRADLPRPAEGVGLFDAAEREFAGAV